MNLSTPRRALAAILAAALLPAACLVKAQLTHDRKIQMAEKIIESFYVADVDTVKMVDEAIRAMLRTLDPHSQYTTPDETRQFNEPLQGNFSGIGIQFQMLDDTLYVVQTIAGGPSERVGLQAGDRIISAGDSMLSGVKRTNTSVQKILRGPKDTQIDVNVLRDTDTIAFLITRDDIPLHSVDAAFMAEPGVGYIRLSRFGEDTHTEVIEAIEKLRGQGMRALMLDVQDNGGGYLQSACAIAADFLDEDDLIVYTDGERAPSQRFVTPRRGRYRDMPLTVLVNQYSASAAEILAGAVQDNDRGVVVGRRTFGKGLVQRPFPFPDGSMIRLTTARYHTPSGRCIQKPYSSGDEKEYARDMMERLRSGELTNADSMRVDSTQLFHTLRAGRPVYGGGGIIPDVFVPLDTTEVTKYYRDLNAKGLLNRVAVLTVDRNRAALRETYPTPESFIDGFEADAQLIDELVALGSERGVEPNPDELAVSLPLVKRLLKAMIGRDLFEQEILWRILQPYDPVFRAGLDTFRV